tara:strand:+ start:91 stop:741 length:651 start_codon:yes stop_codon:yes gene_type:complete
MNPNKNECGFTLIELLMASLLGSLLIIAAFGMLYDSIRVADVLRSRAELNAAARESFDILLDGGISDGIEVIGLRGRPASALPLATDLTDIDLNDPVNNNFRVKLDTDTPGSAANLVGPTVVPQNITCRAAGNPIPACENRETLSVNGFLVGIPRIYSVRADLARDVIDPRNRRRTREIELTIGNPYILADTAEDVPTTQSLEVYRTIFQLNADID